MTKPLVLPPGAGEAACPEPAPWSAALAAAGWWGCPGLAAAGSAAAAACSPSCWPPAAPSPPRGSTAPCPCLAACAGSCGRLLGRLRGVGVGWLSGMTSHPSPLPSPAPSAGAKSTSAAAAHGSDGHAGRPPEPSAAPCGCKGDCSCPDSAGAAASCCPLLPAGWAGLLSRLCPCAAPAAEEAGEEGDASSPSELPPSAPPPSSDSTSPSDWLPCFTRSRHTCGDCCDRAPPIPWLLLVPDMLLLLPLSSGEEGDCCRAANTCANAWLPSLTRWDGTCATPLPPVAGGAAAAAGRSGLGGLPGGWLCRGASRGGEVAARASAGRLCAPAPPRPSSCSPCCSCSPPCCCCCCCVRKALPACLRPPARCCARLPEAVSSPAPAAAGSPPAAALLLPAWSSASPPPPPLPIASVWASAGSGACGCEATGARGRAGG
jgi:hypothetical protein